MRSLSLMFQHYSPTLNRLPKSSSSSSSQLIKSTPSQQNQLPIHYLIQHAIATLFQKRIYPKIQIQKATDSLYPTLSISKLSQCMYYLTLAQIYHDRQIFISLTHTILNDHILSMQPYTQQNAAYIIWSCAKEITYAINPMFNKDVCSLIIPRRVLRTKHIRFRIFKKVIDYLQKNMKTDQNQNFQLQFVAQIAYAAAASGYRVGTGKNNEMMRGFYGSLYQIVSQKMVKDGQKLDKNDEVSLRDLSFFVMALSFLQKQQYKFIAQVVQRLAFDELEQELSPKDSYNNFDESNKKIVALIEILTSIACMGEQNLPIYGLLDKCIRNLCLSFNQSKISQAISLLWVESFYQENQNYQKQQWNYNLTKLAQKVDNILIIQNGLDKLTTAQKVMYYQVVSLRNQNIMKPQQLSILLDAVIKFQNYIDTCNKKQSESQHGQDIATALHKHLQLLYKNEDIVRSDNIPQTPYRVNAYNKNKKIALLCLGAAEMMQSNKIKMRGTVDFYMFIQAIGYLKMKIRGLQKRGWNVKYMSYNDYMNFLHEHESIDDIKNLLNEMLF